MCNLTEIDASSFLKVATMFPYDLMIYMLNSADFHSSSLLSIILISLSNMAFAALLFSQFLPVRHMGGLMVFAMLSTSVGTLTLLASVMELLRRNKKIYNRLIRGN